LKRESGLKREIAHIFFQAIALINSEYLLDSRFFFMLQN